MIDAKVQFGALAISNAMGSHWSVADKEQRPTQMQSKLRWFFVKDEICPLTRYLRSLRSNRTRMMMWSLSFFSPSPFSQTVNTAARRHKCVSPLKGTGKAWQ